MDHAFLGPAYSDDEIEQFLRWSKLPYRRLNAVADEVADILAQDKIIGWFQHRMEFGPRALGARSILASPLSPRCRHDSMRSRSRRLSASSSCRAGGRGLELVCERWGVAIYALCL